MGSIFGCLSRDKRGEKTKTSQLLFKIQVTPWSLVLNKNLYLKGVDVMIFRNYLNLQEPELADEDFVELHPTYDKFLCCLGDKLWKDKTWPNELLNEKQFRTVESYVHSFLMATSKIVDSILEGYSSKFTQEEKEFLKN